MPWKPSLWASRIPRDPTARKPNHDLEKLRVVWTNRDQIPYGWRILRHGVCDGCAPGTKGLRDWTMEGVHLCMVRLELMRSNYTTGFEEAKAAIESQGWDSLERESGATRQEMRRFARMVRAARHGSSSGRWA